MKIGDLVIERSTPEEQAGLQPARLGIAVDMRYQWSAERDYEQRFQVVFSGEETECERSEYDLVVISEI
jgi:hypothetical protein|tara:strand:- start:2873 stop:3079 length:207 start_codon:yes stop_codon:yes gene_type:complete